MKRILILIAATLIGHTAIAQNGPPSLDQMPNTDKGKKTEPAAQIQHTTTAPNGPPSLDQIPNTDKGKKTEQAAQIQHTTTAPNGSPSAEQMPNTDKGKKTEPAAQIQHTTTAPNGSPSADQIPNTDKGKKTEQANIWYDESKPWRAVDYDSIAQSVALVGTPNYYPTLLERYNSADTTLTTEDFRLLYYGYPTQPTYRPLINSLYADSLSFSFGRRTNPTPQEFRRMERYAKAILAEEPFSMRDLNVLAFIYQKLGEEELAWQQMFKIEGITAAIQSSGTGFFQRSPFYITYMRDAEDLLTLLQAKHLNAIAVNRKLEYFPVSNLPTKGMKGLFFNYSEVYKRKPDYIDAVKTKRKFEINPLYNPKSKSNVLPY